jgi:hypothetical protein
LGGGFLLLVQIEARISMVYYYFQNQFNVSLSGEVGGTVCLFCPATYVDKSDLLNHMLEVSHQE